MRFITCDMPPQCISIYFAQISEEPLTGRATHRQSADEHKQVLDKLILLVYEERVATALDDMRFRISKMPPQLTEDRGIVHESVLGSHEDHERQTLSPSSKEVRRIMRSTEDAVRHLGVLRNAAPEPFRLLRVCYTTDGAGDETVYEIGLGPAYNGSVPRSGLHPEPGRFHHCTDVMQAEKSTDRRGTVQSNE